MMVHIGPEVKIHVASSNELSRENALKRIRSLIQDEVEEKKSKREIQAVPVLLEGITKDGSKVESVKSGSILLNIKCFSIKGLTKLMLYMGSQELRNAIKEIEEEIGGKVATVIKKVGEFYAAEDYHQDYLDKNENGYCHIDLSKVK